MANGTKDVKTVPAGRKDNFEIAVMDINNIVEYNRFVLKTRGKKIQILSTELEQGMSIKAYNGGKPLEVER